jgi:hypothetical protein
MAASFHQGFSDHRAEFDVEIGHYLGLRWFHLSSGTDPAWKPPAAIRTRRLAVWQQLRDLADTAASASRSFSLTEQAFWDDLNAQLDAFDAKLAGPQVPRLSGAKDYWHRGENVAKCLVNGPAHDVPAGHCGCGFWAYWALGEKQVSLPSVVGIVKGYGEVIEGELGFRASHAKIIALFPLVYSTELALALEDAYAPVFHSFQAMLEMNKAPAGQPYLSDAYFARRRQQEEQQQYALAQRKAQRAASRTATHAAFRLNAAPCMKCGAPACAQGQAHCLTCQVSDIITGLTA